MSRVRLLLLIAPVLLGLGLPPVPPATAAATSDALVIDRPREPKEADESAALGAVHPDVEVTARVRGGGVGGFWAAGPGRSGAGGLVSGTPDELRSLIESGIVGSLEVVVDMWEADVVSQGVSGQVEAWHGAGWTGRGMKIGILDSSFAGYEALLGTELPDTVTAQSFHFEGLERGTNKHGTAVAEIVHDLVPDADLVLVNADPDSLPDAIDFFIAQDVDIINLSGGWSVGPFDGTAEQDVQANRAIDAGIVWVNAAGNEADQHFAADYVDVDLDGWSEIAGSVEINDFVVPAGDSFQIVLNWTEPTKDLDLCLWDLDAPIINPGDQPVREIDCSEAIQNAPFHRPLEVIDWINTYGESHQFGFSIGGNPLDPATGVHFDVFTNVVEDLGVQTPETSLLVPSATERVITVGAVPWYNRSAVESFSSQGPTADGRVKPDLVGPSQVRTDSFGSSFAGSSAAAPYVTGLAALYLARNPDATPIDVRRELGQLADGVGKDNVFGWGYAELGEPGGERVAFQDPDRGEWSLRMPDGRTEAFYYGVPSDVPLMCDWLGSGVASPGLYRQENGYMYLRYTNDFGVADLEFFYGIAEDMPVCGDWDGDGIDTVGVFRPSQARFFLSNTNEEGVADVDFYFGTFGDVPFAGDWDGDGVDTVGLYRPSNGFVYITNENTTKFADVESFFGVPGDRFVVGDWDGDGDDTFGIFRPSESMFYLANEIGQLVANQVVDFGSASSMPVAGVFE